MIQHRARNCHALPVVLRERGQDVGVPIQIELVGRNKELLFLLLHELDGLEVDLQPFVEKQLVAEVEVGLGYLPQEGVLALACID